MIFVCLIAGLSTAFSQQPDTTHQVIFPATGTGMFLPKSERTIDLALTGGAGYYREGDITTFQPSANADFFARTNDLDFSVGAHWGFSDPSTKALTLGLRFPIKESEDRSSGFFADADLMFTDNGEDSGSFSTGLRAALAARTGAIELRVVGEIQRFPFGGDQFQAWGGIELGFVVNLLREEISEPTPKDSLRQALRYIATSDELEQLDKAQSSTEIDHWLDRFWQARNVTGSPRNDAREEYMQRVRTANEKYGTPRTMGVSTDRGRVLLLYGKPDHIETANSVNGPDRRFELWVDENRVQGHQIALFLFVSSQFSAAKGIYEGHGDYREIYSNVGGEPWDRDNSDPADGLPIDLPSSMKNYIDGFR
jgi:GWxTD domain-containing protein